MICKCCSGSGLFKKKKAAGLPRICCLRRRRRLRRGCAGGFAARRRSAGSPPPRGGGRAAAPPFFCTSLSRRDKPSLRRSKKDYSPKEENGRRSSCKGVQSLWLFLTPAPQRAPAAGAGTVAEAPAAVRRLPPAPAAVPFPVWGLSASARPSFSPPP